MLAPMADGPPVPADEWFSFLLVRLGTYVASGFAEALAPLGIEPRHFGILNRIAANEGASQQTLATRLGLHPTRMVFAVDELEERGLVERRRNPNDRRSYALHLTPDGRKLLQKARGIAGKRAGELGKGLTARERKELTRLLQKVSDEQGLAPEGLPMGGGPPPRIVKKVSTRPARRAGTAAR
jgi:DNA-binding MarR family transcriptional regulator